VPASLEITDAEAVPLAYKTVSVTMPAVAYEVIKATLALAPDTNGASWAELDRNGFDFAKLPAHYSIDNAAVKAALVAGNEVPGADLKIGGYALVVR
jgi:hypothetical protein